MSYDYGKAQRLYRTKRWRKGLRPQQLRKEPLCRDCKERGVLTEATEVDHVEPHRGDTRKFFDRRNLASRCKPCHSAKTGREVAERRWLETTGKGTDANGYPLDPAYKEAMKRYA